MLSSSDRMRSPFCHPKAPAPSQRPGDEISESMHSHPSEMGVEGRSFQSPLHSMAPAPSSAQHASNPQGRTRGASKGDISLEENSRVLPESFSLSCSLSQSDSNQKSCFHRESSRSAAETPLQKSALSSKKRGQTRQTWQQQQQQRANL